MYPHTLSLIRHAQSAGNVANDAARRDGLPELDLALRDMDVPLSVLGEQQSRQLGAWFAQHPSPDVVFCSPYKRAVDTAALAMKESGIDAPVVLDERLREREFGILDRLTSVGIKDRYPEQAAARAFLGKFFHRPPGGESWADVAGRVRGFITDLRADYADRDVVVVTHQAVIMLFRYVLETMTEAELLSIDRGNQIVNTAVSVFESDGQSMQLRVFNDAAHLAPEEATAASDQSAAPR